MHYGDSQIEMDRISSIIREHLQGIFGGNGNGLVPAIQSVSTYSLVQSATGDLTRYTLIGDSTTVRAEHNRYGLMTQLSQLSGEASISFRVSKNSNCQERAKKFSKVSLLIGNSSPGFRASLRCDTIRTESKVLKNAVQGVSLLTWDLLRMHPKALLLSVAVLKYMAFSWMVKAELLWITHLSEAVRVLYLPV